MVIDQERFVITEPILSLLILLLIDSVEGIGLVRIVEFFDLLCVGISCSSRVNQDLLGPVEDSTSRGFHLSSC